MSGTPRILIFGAGAVGQFLGGTLARAGQEVTLLVRPALRETLARQPLVLGQLGLPDCPVQIRAVTRIDDLPDQPALVILTVKSYDTERALPDLRRLVAGGATVLTVQNGVGNEEALIAGLGVVAVRSGAFTISVSTAEPGRVVRHTAKGGLGLAPIAREDLGPLRDLFAGTGLPVVTARSYRVLKWSKLLLNMLANAQSALLDLPPGTLLADPRTFLVEQRAFHEARAVMRASGIGLTDLPAYPVRALAAAMALPAPLARPLLAARVRGGRGAKMPSLWLDLHAARGRSEVGWLNGAVAEAGQQRRLPTPVNTTLTQLLAAATADPAAWTPFRAHPERLLAALGS